MRRITISVDDALADAFEHLIAVKAYVNRSEAFRDLVRKALDEAVIEDADHAQAECVASLSYVYDHHERQLASRVNQLQHDHHDVIVTAQHVHLDHDNCMETVILRGKIAEVEACVNAISSQKGVTHAKVHIIPRWLSL
ncbi:nickel-responsive transcriptional regulator NikR [Methylophilus sp. DW102]|uniref:nickel-responsive transcriptional regulator NikR n=1 Tax=Methylophilus sp. DW102 TaxID=3095607 RepID=UPI003092D924|nr:nickel-responsive transcriptional regulator NikR [Methylophilus sp. DW102]